jgi:hypothetical protein
VDGGDGCGDEDDGVQQVKGKGGGKILHLLYSRSRLRFSRAFG